jgi:hypothetical protein
VVEVVELVIVDEELVSVELVVSDVDVVLEELEEVDEL